MKLKIDASQSEKQIGLLLNKLFPIHRTLVNEGFKESLNIINEYLPLNVKSYESGKEVYDWKIPNSWNVQKATISDPEGNVLIDFKNNNLHLSAYSQEFKGEISHKDLLNHINFREELPEAIPYNFHYYKEDWSFNLSYNQFKKDFKHKEYNVEIKTDEYPDFLRAGELVLEGQSEEEIWITTYMCHPSMVNDNLSGVVVAVELFKYLSQIPYRKYTYRLIIIPETIGAITYISQNEGLLDKVKAGFTVYCCGDEGNLHYKKTYGGDSYIDKVVDYGLNKYVDTSEFKILDFWPGGSDERQFNGTGIRMPMGAVTKTPAAEFKEYHTSLDNLELIKEKDLVDTLEKVALLINIIEADELFINNYKGEPCFSRHDIAYPKFKDALSKSSAYNVKILANEVDGTMSLLEIAKKWNLNIFHLAEISKSFEKENLFKKK